MSFIDIHGHYAWNIDDGMPSYDDARKALELARENRISAIVATPHVTPGVHTKDDIHDFIQRIDDLRMLATEYNIDILDGCELFLNHDYQKALDQNLFIPIENTQYVLVEFDVRKEIGNEQEVEERLYDVQFKGYTPIIAHVERYFKNGLDIERVNSFIESGCIIQVNATSFLGYHGKQAKKIAFQLLDEGLIHVIATDTHRATGSRKPCLNKVFYLLEKKYNYHAIHTLMSENPLHILKNEWLEPVYARESFFKKLAKKLKSK